MLKRIGLIAGLLALGIATAQAGSVSGLTAATSVGGTDLFYDVQTPGSGGVKATAAQIAVYTLGLVTGDCTINTGTNAITCTKTSGTAFGAFATGTDAANLTGTINAARLPGTASFSALTASTSLTLSAITGSTQCLQVGSTGIVSGTGAACGGSGSTGANPTATASDTAVNGVATTFMRSDAAPAIQKGSSTQFGLMKCDGTTILCGSGIIQTGATVTAGTTQTVTATQWAGGTTFAVTTSGQTLTLPNSSTLSANGGIAIQTIGQSVTLAPNATDAINGGTAGASVTIASGLTAYVTTDGAGNIHASPTSAGGGSGTVTSMSVVSANGLAGSVANATTTPAVTLSTTVTGIVKGNGTSLSAATAGTDYQSPITLTTTGTSGAATFVGNTLNIPQYSGGGGGSGSLIKIGTATASNSTCLSWGVAVSGCVNGSTTDLSTLGYNTLFMTCSGIKPGTASGQFYLHVAEGATPTIETSNYGWSVNYSDLATVTGTQGGGTTFASNVGFGVMNNIITTATGSAQLYLTTDTAQIPRAYTLVNALTPQSLTVATSIFRLWGGGVYTGDQNAITAITFDLYSGLNGTQKTGAAGIVSGSCTLYGITN